MADTPQIVISSQSTGLPPAPAGYRWEGNPPKLVPQTTTVVGADGQTREIAVSPPLQVGTDGTQFDGMGYVVASYGPDGQPTGGAVLGEKRQVATAVMQPGQTIMLDNGFSQTKNDHGTLDLTYPDGHTRPGASAPGTVNADGSVTPAAVNAGGDLGHNIARNVDPAGIFDPNGSHIGGVLDPANVSGWDQKNGGSGGLLGGSNLATDGNGGSLIGGLKDAAGSLFGGGGNGGGAPTGQIDLGRDPNFVNNTISGARATAGQQSDEMRAIGNNAQQTGASYGADTAAAGLRGEATGAGIQSALKGEADLAKARGADLGQGIAGLESTEGPSAAQAMLQSGTNQAIDNALAIARSHRGFGGSAAGVAQAAAGMPAAQAAAANQAATLRANENALWRARQAQNLGTAAQVEQRGLDQSIGATQAGGQAALTGTGQAASGASAGGQVALTGTGQQAAATSGGQDSYWKGEGLASGLAGKQGDIDVGVRNAATQKYGIDKGVPTTFDKILGAASTGAALLASDERNKNIDHEVKLSSAIRGNPYGSTGAPGAEFRKAGEAIADRDAESRLQAAIRRTSGMMQQPQQPQVMQPVVSDERSKNKIDDLEAQLAAARQGLSGPPATAGVPRRDVNTAALDAATPDFRQSPNYAYTYKDPTIPGAAPGPQVGPMAQDLEKAGSQSVVNTPTGKMVDPGRVALETAGAVGELQGNDQAQQSRQDDLERQFAELEAMLKAPKNRSSQGASAR